MLTRFFILGQNPGTNHPRMLSALQKAARRGCQIVSINPLPEAGTTRFIHPQEFTNWLGKGTPLATLFLQVKINGDVPLLKGIMKELVLREDQHPGTVLDSQFIQESTEGFEPFSEALRKLSWQDIEAGCGNQSRIDTTGRRHCHACQISDLHMGHGHDST